LVPEDEEELAKNGWADDVRTFKPGSLDRLTSAAEAIAVPLQVMIEGFSSNALQVGFEATETSEPSSYAAIHLYSGQMRSLLQEAAPRSTLHAADDLLADLRATKTNFEITRLRLAGEIAGKAFSKGAEQMRVGQTEVEAASNFREPLSESLVECGELQRSDGFAWCMSGSNSALAAGAYARSRPKKIGAGDLVLVHMNSYADGYWTDVTRTFVMGAPNDLQQEMYDAVTAARQAALDAIRPGAKGSDVDTAARDVLQSRGYGPNFKHSTGHGIGFSAIDANAKPRLHPKSNDMLEVGMVFNVEPAIYFEGYAGMRHCDMVTVTESSAELLTPFQSCVDELVLRG
jgi:Xaa-Pro aminopeptidase